MAKKIQPKKTKKTETPTNGVSSRLILESGDQDTVRMADKKLATLQTNLGVLTETFERQKAQILNELTKSRQDFQSVLKTVGSKHGVDLDKEPGAWGFDFDTMEFSRRQQRPSA